VGRLVRDGKYKFIKELFIIFAILFMKNNILIQLPQAVAHNEFTLLKVCITDMCNGSATEREAL
jgi:hypothetical protein